MEMTKEPKLQMEFEPVDDIPLLLEQMKIMSLSSTIDEHIKPHGNWTGITLGQLAIVALTYILSQANHFLCAILPWAQQRLKVLQTLLPFAWQDRDLTDDRLAILLRRLSDDQSWYALEAALNRRTIRVFELQDEFIRLDSTTAKGYWRILMDSLFQRGHSKDRRPDLPQVRIMMGTIDPLGSPLYTQVYNGNRTDDRLYVPAVQEIKTGLARDGLVFVGDCKMGSIWTRAVIVGGKDYYLCPLAGVQLPTEQKKKLIQAALSGEVDIIPISRTNESNGKLELLGYGYETTVACEYQLEDKKVQWDERRFVVLSLRLMQQEYELLSEQAGKALQELQQLNVRKRGKKVCRERTAFEQKVESILKKRGVAGVVKVEIHEQVEHRTVRKWGSRAARTEVTRHFEVSSKLDSQELFEAAFLEGWRVLATNAPANKLGMEDAYVGYRKSHRIDGVCFRSLKGFPLNLVPTYLSRPDHVKGMVRLLSLGLRVLGEIQFVARRALAESDEKLEGLYPGNPKRKTARPTATLLLRVFKPIALLSAQLEEEGQPQRAVTALSELQKKILLLLGFPEHIYLRLEQNGAIFRTPT